MSSELDQFDADDSLDATLKEFFSGSLSGQVGRAEREFQSHLRSEAKSGRRQRTLLILAFTGSMAATIAGLWASPLLRTIAPVKTQSLVKADPSPVTAPATPVMDVVEHLTASRTIDEGVMMLEGEPVRVYRKHSLEQTNVLDENDQVTSQETTPSDTLVFVKVNTY
jgi:hypothetical protein